MLTLEVNLKEISPKKRVRQIRMKMKSAVYLADGDLQPTSSEIKHLLLMLLLMFFLMLVLLLLLFWNLQGMSVHVTKTYIFCTKNWASVHDLI